MLTNDKKECPFTDEIVSYMYGEIDGVEREVFETHLADCSTCTDDFAAISNSRFSVFEWRKEEFDQLTTPSFVIPELAKSKLATHSEAGWFAGLRALLSFARSPIAVAAALLVCLGVGLVMLAYFRSSESLIADKIDVSFVKNTEPENRNRDIVDAKPPTNQPNEPTRISTSKKSNSVYKTVPATEIKRFVNNSPKRNLSPQAKKPVLNDFNEETDKSLRLSDLFDEVGG